MTSVLEFVGEPFDAAARAAPPPSEVAAALPTPDVPERTAPAAPETAALRETVAQAHRSALRVQEALQRRMLASGRAVHRAEMPAPAPVGAAPEGAFKPLARSTVTTLDAAALARLAAGDVAGVFGPAYHQHGANAALRFAGGARPVLGAVRQIELRGGAAGAGRVLAEAEGDAVAAVVEAAQVFALFTGLHLCLADAEFVVTAPPGGTLITGTVDLEVTAVDLVPRPGLTARAAVAGAGAFEVSVEIRERPGTPAGPGIGGRGPWLGRLSAAGERALLSELHMAHLARGDQGLAMGPEFATNTGRRATRLPTGGLLLVDRVVHVDGERGRLDGARYETEYDSPADSWYYADTANASMPHCVYMETSLQAALLIGYYLGPTLAAPDATVSLRNLGGTATVLREVDLRNATIRQSSELVSTTLLPGATLQEFRYSLAVDGEPFYRGETMFGYFGDAALANQTGLDGGRSRPTWLDEQQPRPRTRSLDLTARRADPDAPLCSRGKLALLDEIDVVDGGGRHGAGYLHAVRAIDPADWFFARHFHLDPVVPGSLGVESVIQAMQEWLLDSGHADHLRDPEFVVPVGEPFAWRYRGQFLPTDGTCTLEVHLRDVVAAPGRVRVGADASMWKPGLRIYELTGVAVELREAGVQ